MVQPKRDLAYRILREKILSGKLPPGVDLNVDELSADFGMNAHFIYEALQRLETEALVIMDLSGARVTPIQREAFNEIFEVQAALQLISGRAACRKMTPADLTELEALFYRLEGAVAHPESWFECELELHCLLCDKANMPLLKTLILQVADHWRRLRRYCLEPAAVDRIPVAQQEYRALLTALFTGKPDQVSRLLVEHHQRRQTDYLAYLNSPQLQNV